MEVRNYRDLQVWQKARELVKGIYDASAAFPKEELYGLTSQLRRASISIASNLAEGSSRKSTAEFIRFINIACGSLAEVETQLILANDLSFLTQDALSMLLDKTAEINRMLYALHRSLRERTAA